MFLFVFNSPTNWCKNYGDRSYSFRDITRFATVYFADRSYDTASAAQCSVKNYVTRRLECLPLGAVADISVVVVPLKCASCINNNRIIVIYSENSALNLQNL